MPSDKLAVCGVVVLGFVATVCVLLVGGVLATIDAEKTTVALKPVVQPGTTTTPSKSSDTASTTAAPVTAVTPTVKTENSTLRTAALTVLGSTAAAAIGGIAGLLSVPRKSSGSETDDPKPS